LNSKENLDDIGIDWSLFANLSWTHGAFRIRKNNTVSRFDNKLERRLAGRRSAPAPE